MVVSYPMFSGEYEYRLDEKGRVPIPPKFRTEELKKEGVMLRPGFEKCVIIYTLSEWKKYTESFTAAPIIPSKLRKLKRAIFATAFNAELDAQGRISIPLNLRQHASLEDSVVMVGTDDYLELWSKKLWDEERANDLAESLQILDTMERR